MPALPPTLIAALHNQKTGRYQSEGHLTACKNCGYMMYHNISGSSEDLCWIDLEIKGRVFSTRVYLCSMCLRQVKKEMANMSNNCAR